MFAPKHILSLLCCFVMLNANSQFGKYRHYNFDRSNGKWLFPETFTDIWHYPMFSEYDSLPTGDWVQLYASGQVALAFSISDYLINGPAVLYRKDNSIWRKVNFYYSHFHGQLKTFDRSGNLVSSFQYQEGAMDGPWVMYYPSGQIRAKGNHKNNMKVGKVIHYFKNGNLKEVWTYKYNKLNGLNTAYYKKGYKKYEGNLSGINNKVGRWVYWYPNGQKHKTVNYINGIEVLNGAWFRDGQLMIKNGTGNYLYKSIDGHILIEGKYINGYRENKWLFYHKNGSIEYKFYKNGLTR